MSEAATEAAKQDGGIGVARIFDIDAVRPATTEALSELIWKAVGEPFASHGSEGALFAGIDALLRKRERVVVVIANVDALARHLAVSLLDGLQRRAAEGRVIAMVSGQSDLAAMLQDATVAPGWDRYFVQRFDRDVFDLFFDRYAQNLGLGDSDAETMRQRLWSLSGGMPYPLRLLLASFMEDRARGATRQPLELHAELEPWLGSAPMAYWSAILQNATRLIWSTPACWRDLETMLREDFVEVPLADGPPQPLEFAGVGERDVARRRIGWTCQVVKTLIGRYYAGRRLADMYAQAGRWDEAFERYAGFSPSVLRVPFDSDGRLSAMAAVDALCGHLHTQVDYGPDKTIDLFESGCRGMLGFDSVSFWRLEKGWRRDRWAGDSAEQVNDLLPASPQREGWWPLPSARAKHTAAILYRGARGQWKASVLSDSPSPEESKLLDGERALCTRKLVSAFEVAHRRALLIAGQKERAESRGTQQRLLGSIWNSFTLDLMDIPQILELAADELLAAGYFRVLFCFVDETRAAIQGAVDRNRDPRGVDVAKLTKKWPLSEPMSDIQPYVVCTRAPKIVPYPEHEPLIDPNVREKAVLRPMAVMPIFTPDRQVMGTIHIERNDGLVPEPEEVADLMLFGSNLAAMIESGRLGLLARTLEGIPSPVAVTGTTWPPLYANHPARELFGIPENRSHDGGGALKALDPRIEEDIRVCITQNQRLASVHRGQGLPYDALVVYQPTQAPRAKADTAVAHVQNLTWLERVLALAGKLAATRAEDDGTPRITAACKSLLHACLDLGARAARLYWLRGRDPEELVGYLWVGDGKDVHKTGFPEKVWFQRRGPDDFRWRAIRERTPEVFRFEPGGVEGAQRRTFEGLGYRIITKPLDNPYLPWPPGEYRVDIPLYTDVAVLGKITLEYEKPPKPEELLQIHEVLSMVVKPQLAALVASESELARHDETITRAVAEYTLAEAAHTINARLAALPFFVERYRDAEKDPAILPELNRRFHTVLKRATDTVKRAKLYLGRIPVHPERFDLAGTVEEWFQTATSDETWTCGAPERPFEVEWDKMTIEDALLELISNSQQAASSIRIGLTLDRFERTGRNWVRMLYSDDGPGIPPESADQIFALFYTSRAPGSRGTGLGMHIVKRIVEAQGGTIAVVEHSGRGARFQLELPQTVEGGRA
jgi:signal transduction histidine kinase